MGGGKIKIDKHDLVLILGLILIVAGLIYWALAFDFAFVGIIETGFMMGFGAGLLVLWGLEQRKVIKNANNK